MNALIANWHFFSWSFFWDLVAALLFGFILFALGYLLGYLLWKDRRARVDQAPRANESLRNDIERLESEVNTLETA